jgi:predicted nucleic acid-binding protein
VSGTSRVYIDANVFAYRLISHPSYLGWLFQKSDKFFQDIISSKYEGVISNWTELEYRGLIKKVLSDIKKGALTQLEESTAMNDFTHFLAQLGIGIMDSDILSINSSQQADLFKSTTSIIGNSIPIYRSNSNPNQNPWRSIGGADGLMVNLAIRSGASYLATFDRAFAGLNNPNLKTIMVPDVY